MHNPYIPSLLSICVLFSGFMAILSQALEDNYWTNTNSFILRVEEGVHYDCVIAQLIKSVKDGGHGTYVQVHVRVLYVRSRVQYIRTHCWAGQVHRVCTCTCTCMHPSGELSNSDMAITYSVFVLESDTFVCSYLCN